MPLETTVEVDFRKCTVNLFDGNKILVGMFYIDSSAFNIIRDVSKIADQEEISHQIKQWKDLELLKTHPTYGNFLNLIATNLSALNQFSNYASKFEKNEVPILFLRNSFNTNDAFNKTVKSSMIQEIHILLQLLCKYDNHPGFNCLVDQHVTKMIKMGVVLDTYFASKLTMFKIDDIDFVSAHKDDSTLIVSYSSEDHERIQNERSEKLFT